MAADRCVPGKPLHHCVVTLGTRVRKDPRLERDVSIKVLPSDFSHDPEQWRRFEPEARADPLISRLCIFSLKSEHGYENVMDP